MENFLLKLLLWLICFVVLGFSGVAFILGVQWEDTYTAIMSSLIFVITLICFFRVDSFVKSGEEKNKNKEDRGV
jgi:polyferredoxin